MNRCSARAGLPDNERLCALGEYDPDVQGQWAMGSDQEFSNLHQKYNVSHQLANPSSGALNRQDVEGAKYRLEDRILNLVEEFMERCPG